MIGMMVAATDAEIAALLASPDDVEDFVGDEDRAAHDVDKAWHALHFLQTGSVWGGAPPLDFWCRGGAQIGDVDIGYGPARAFTAREVRAISEALAPLDVDALFARWDVDAMRAGEVYGVRPDDPDSERDYVGGYFESTKAFLAERVAAGEGVLVYLS